VHRFLADIGEDEKAAQYFLKSYDGLGKSTTSNGVLCFRLLFLFELQLWLVVKTGSGQTFKQLKNTHTELFAVRSPFFVWHEGFNEFGGAPNFINGGGMFLVNVAAGYGASHHQMFWK
jgi:hypothetical protein